MNKPSTQLEDTENKENTAKLDILNVEQALSQQGHFCFLDWLLAENFLLYADYEKWRYGDIAHLDKHIKLTKKQLLALASNIESYGTTLHLEAQNEEYYPWSESKQQALSASKHTELNKVLTQQWKRHQDLHQMDLFMDNTASIAENALLNALAQRQYEQAQNQLEKLAQLQPTHEKLGGYQDLINYGYHMQSTSIAAETISDELHGLEGEVLPLANSLLKNRARDYLAFAWRRLEQNLVDTPFNPQNDKIHRSYVLMQIPDWENLEQCLSREAEQFQQATLLLRSAQCYEALKASNKALLCWCLFMELDRKKCEAAIESKTSNLVWNLWQDFWYWHESYESQENQYSPVDEDRIVEFFPAYILKRHPSLLHQLDSAPELKSAASQAVIAAIRSLQAGQDPIPSRKHLQQIHPSLLAMYLSP